MKIYTLFLIFICVGNILHAQLDAATATRAEEELIELSNSITELLYQNQAVSLYSNYSATPFYASRLTNAQQMIDEISKIQKTFQQLSESNRSEKDYYIKLAYCDLLIVSIVANRDQYIEVFSTLSASNNYAEKYKEWEKLEYLSISNARKRLSTAFILDNNNLDIKIIEALLLFFEKQYDQSFNALDEIANYLEDNNPNASIGEDVTKAPFMGYLYSWLSYICIKKKAFESAEEYLNLTKAINEPIDNVIWARNAEKILNRYGIDNYDIDIVTFKAPSKAMFDQREFKLEGSVFNDLSFSHELYKGKLSYQLKELSVSLDIRPELLIKDMMEKWNELINVENDSWNKANDFFNTSLKNSKVAGEKAYIVLTYYNGFGQLNRNRHLKRFQKVFNLLESFKRIRIGWNSLVMQNPDIFYYRINRIKNNLAIYYIVSRENNFTDILYYYNFNGQKIEQQDIAKIKESFNVNVINDINEDVEYLKIHYPNHLESLLVQIEVAIFVYDFESAKSTLDIISKKINSLTDDPNYHGQIEKYEGYLYFKYKDYKTAKANIENIANYENLQTFYRDMKNKIFMIENHIFKF
jgi:hypothetical protein